MRSRNIKPGFFQNDILGGLSPHARLMFIGLWCIADFRGNLENRPMKIKGLLFPYEDINPVPYMDELFTSGFIQRYQDGSGGEYIHIPNFGAHQSPHKNERDRGAKIPDISECCPSTVREPYRDGIDTEPVGLIPDTGYLKPDTGTLNPEGGTRPRTVLFTDDVLAVFQMYAETCKALPQVRNPEHTEIGRKIAKQIKERTKGNGLTLDDWQALFDYVAASDFLTGKNDRGWTASLDWIVAPGNFGKVLSRKYKNSGAGTIKQFVDDTEAMCERLGIND